MRDGRYAEFPAHKADHERLLDEIRDLMGRLRRRRVRRSGAIAGDLERWFSVHFSTHDAALHRWSARRRPERAENATLGRLQVHHVCGF